MAQLLTVIGNIASGKSTLMPILTRSLRATSIDADTLFQEKDPFAKPYLADMKRWALTNELWLTYERVRIMRECVASSNTGLVVIDSGLLMSWVYTYSHRIVGNITEDEWVFYQRLFDDLTKGMFRSSYVVSLEYNLDTLLERLTKRGRDYELAFYTREYLGQIELGLQALLEKLRSKDEAIVISVLQKDTPDFEKYPEQAKKIVERVRSQLDQKVE